MKYVIVESAMAALPIVFSEMQQHADVAHAFARRPKDNETYKDVIIGAGFCQITVEKVETLGGQTYNRAVFVCYGESISLNVKSREDEDSKFLNKYFGVIQEY
jgi:hypothetical protein